jgi:hypothetical protein
MEICCWPPPALAVGVASSCGRLVIEERSTTVSSRTELRQVHSWWRRCRSTITDSSLSLSVRPAGSVVIMSLGGLCRQSMMSGIVRLLKYNPTAQPKRRTGYLRCRAAVGRRRPSAMESTKLDCIPWWPRPARGRAHSDGLLSRSFDGGRSRRHCGDDLRSCGGCNGCFQSR